MLWKDVSMKTLPLPRWIAPGQSLSTAVRPGFRPATAPQKPQSISAADSGRAVTILRNGETGLSKNAVLRLGSRSGFEKITVVSGIVWVTAAPGDGDIILRAGESLPLHGGWPVVLQALTDSGIRLIPSTSHE